MVHWARQQSAVVSPWGFLRGYLRNQWAGLVQYLDDGELPIDNNLSEQLMRQVAIGRKNWPFIGSVAAGYRAADLMSLVSSAHRNDPDVWAYVRDVLAQLLSGAPTAEQSRNKIRFSTRSSVVPTEESRRRPPCHGMPMRNLLQDCSYASLRPDIWKQSHPESIRTYRDEERRQTAARRDRTRLERRLARLKHQPEA